MPITVEVHKGYVAFNRIDFTVYDTGIINSIAYVFQEWKMLIQDMKE